MNMNLRGNKFMSQAYGEDGSAENGSGAGFLVRDLVRFFLVDVILVAAQKLLLAIGFFASPDSYVMAVLFSKIALMAYLVWLIRDRRDAWPATGAASAGRWWAWPGGVVLYAVCYPVLLWADQLSQRLMTPLYAMFGAVYVPETQDIVMLIFTDVLDSPLRLALVFFTVLAGPFMEELAFRGLGMDALRREYGTGMAVFWTSLLFGLYHFSLPVLLPLSLLGALFAVARVYSRSLWCPFFLHFLHNSLVLAITAHELTSA